MDEFIYLYITLNCIASTNVHIVSVCLAHYLSSSLFAFCTGNVIYNKEKLNKWHKLWQRSHKFMLNISLFSRVGINLFDCRYFLHFKRKNRRNLKFSRTLTCLTWSQPDLKISFHSLKLLSYIKCVWNTHVHMYGVKISFHCLCVSHKLLVTPHI